MESDYIRNDGRICGPVSSTQTIKTSIVKMEEGWLTLRDFPHPVWFNRFPGLFAKKDTEMYCLLSEYAKDKWKLVYYHQIES